MTAPETCRAQTADPQPEQQTQADEGTGERGFQLDFTWQAPEGCPTRAEVIRELDKAVDPGDFELPPLKAQAVVVEDEGVWRLELVTEMDGRRGTRYFEADNCEGLARAATLVMALTLGEGLARRQQAEAEARAKPPEPAPPPPPLPRPPAPPPAPAPSRALIWAAAGYGSDAVGSYGAGASLGFAFQPSWFEVGAKLSLTLPRSAAFVGSGGDVHSSSFTSDLRACLAPTLQPFQLLACANGGVTVLDAKGRDLARNDRATVPLYGLGPSAGARWLLEETAFLNLDLSSRFFLARPDLAVEGSPRRQPTEAVTLALELGGGVRW